MAADPTAVNAQLAQQLPTNNVGKITAAILVGALTGASGNGITSWVYSNYQPLISTLPVCVSNTVAPVPTGQPYQCSGIVLIAQ